MLSAMRLTQAESERNRKQILEVAGKLFRERGFDRWRRLMKVAGFTRGGFYNHFACKEELGSGGERGGHRAGQRGAGRIAERPGERLLVVTMFLQQGLKYSPLEAAASTPIFTVGSTGSAVISGRLVHRVGRRLVVIGSAVATLGLTVVALLAHGWTGPDAAAVLAAPLLMAGCGCGLVISANQTLALHEITRANAGVAAGIYETGQRIGTALGTALSSALFFRGLATTGGNYHAAVGLGLASPAVLVGVAFLIGTADILWPVRRADQVDGSVRPERVP
jgi:AcrR family transcriptional regulator